MDTPIYGMPNFECGPSQRNIFIFNYDLGVQGYSGVQTLFIIEKLAYIYI